MNMPAGPQTPMRQEDDSLGTMQVPADAYFGVQTVRALQNFGVSDIPINLFPKFIVSLAMVKKAAALANRATHALDPRRADAITAACDEIINGQLHEFFVVDVFQGGAGTSTNMNANEVIANRSLEILGKQKGEYDALHPNDHVNMSQSTNDVYPTAVRLAILLSRDDVTQGLTRLVEAFDQKALELAGVVKIGRTQLQDAVPISLGREIGAYAATIREDVLRLEEAASLFREVNLGGTAVGTRLNASPDYARHAFTELSRISGEPMVQSANLLEASWDAGAFVTFSGVLKRIAVKLSKIANDLRLLSSGPRAGFGEIKLPPMQPGSSIMPGKVNPVIPEAVNQVCFQVIGNDLTVTMAAEAGQLQLNAFEPVIAHNILTSMRLVARACHILADRCVTGIAADVEKCRAGAESSIALATSLVPIIGYPKAARIAKHALQADISVRESALAHGVSDADADRYLNPTIMAGIET